MNGRFYAARATGVQRVATELVARLCDRADVTLRVPRGARVPAPVRERADVVEGRLRGAAWEQLELPADRGGTALELDPANSGPAWAPGRRVLLLHDVLPLSHPDAYSRAFRRWFRHVVVRSARRADLVLMFSEWARNEAVRRLGLAPERVRLLSQGVEPFDRPAAEADVAVVLERFGLDRPFILATGSGDARKNAAFLEGVVRRMETRAAPALVLVGASYGHVHAARPDAQERPGVRRLGHVDDAELHALYSAARVFCFPSRAEGFGRPPLEAMGCGAPVLAADYGPAAEVLGDAASILPLDSAAWAEALAALFDDECARQRRVAAGREHVRAFRWDAAADALVDACETVAAGA